MYNISDKSVKWLPTYIICERFEKHLNRSSTFTNDSCITGGKKKKKAIENLGGGEAIPFDDVVPQGPLSPDSVGDGGGMVQVQYMLYTHCMYMLRIKGTPKKTSTDEGGIPTSSKYGAFLKLK